jgi:hypothetical protein
MTSSLIDTLPDMRVLFITVLAIMLMVELLAVLLRMPSSSDDAE